MSRVRIGFAQYDVVFGNKEANFARIEYLCSRVVGADLLVLPELGATGYEFRDRDEVRAASEPFGEGPTSEWLTRVARHYGMTLVLGYAEREGEALYNACLLAKPNGELANYRKIHLFSRETVLFDPGNAPPPVIDTPAGKVGLMICFDWIFPETCRVLALGGAQIVAHPSNLVLPGMCQRAMAARAMENRVFTVTANRIGEEDRAGRRLRFTGLSQVMSPQGELLAGAPESREHWALAEADPADADSKRITDWNDLFRDRRVELYGGLVE